MGGPFKVPSWASEPQQKASLHPDKTNGNLSETQQEVIDIDNKSCYIIGRDAHISQIVLSHNTVSRIHAAFVHHTDGRIYLIDNRSTHGTLVNQKRIEPHKPFHLRDGQKLQFGGDETHIYVFRCEQMENNDYQKQRIGQKRTRSNDPDERVRVQHILVKHKGSRNPTSWLEPEVTRTVEEAEQLALEMRAKLISGEIDFSTLAEESSHCSSHKRGGDLGFFSRGKMQPEFEEAAFSIDIGEISQPVKSASGVHLILRTG
eukprot:TRINITY_DN24786_c1_g1_i1.p1 TRINITY_DN24786_c1_g1~~TRINITY_DN24786_c1_g1_i1.p1  ORF type:complete len:271 (+),score=25.50 TRINITY_DN24786_c1_g1_i1:34-813(+)